VEDDAGIGRRRTQRDLDAPPGMQTDSGGSSDAFYCALAKHGG